ncbi:hypothetical protein [Agaribacterium haliotis]|uniref:hypothetical protein n=1 Tax=Agaribacterium haliotis TaxID=2013869 RepID=UPI0011773DF0|nr:hypothetical protein [Agaribacterium haliotis]
MFSRMREKAIKLLFAVIILFTASNVYANYIGQKSVTAMYGSGIIFIGVEGAPSDTCHHYGFNFRFDARTPEGKNIFSMLLAAKMADKKINIWYSPSSQPGSDHSNGCSADAVAVLNSIGIS